LLPSQTLPAKVASPAVPLVGKSRATTCPSWPDGIPDAAKVVPLSVELFVRTKAFPEPVAASQPVPLLATGVVALLLVSTVVATVGVSQVNPPSVVL
jgi:hypothetical protein